jgi:HAD superfamily hydrolase (TIGR01490 family)
MPKGIPPVQPLKGPAFGVTLLMFIMSEASLDRDMDSGWEEQIIEKICFFDMDRTLIAGNSGVSFMQYSFRRGKTTRWKLIKSLFDYVRYRYDCIDMEKAYRASLRPLIGVREEELVQFCQEWFEETLKGIIYPEAKATVCQHQDAGETVAIISNAVTHAVDPLARYLGVSHVLATRLEVCEGKFTGSYVSPLCFRKGKVFWAEKLASALGRKLRDSTFYTDSITDLPLLEEVRDPRVVNPDPKLRVVARKRGWPILHFRPPHKKEA